MSPKGNGGWDKGFLWRYKFLYTFFIKDKNKFFGHATWHLDLIVSMCNNLYTLRASLVAQRWKNLPAMLEMQVQCLGQEDPLEKGMAPIKSLSSLFIVNSRGKMILCAFLNWHIVDLQFPSGTVVTEYACQNRGLPGHAGSISELRRSSREGNANPFQCSCQENFTDRGIWWAIVHGVAKSQTQLSTHMCSDL